MNHLASKKIIPIVGFINHYKYSHILFDVLRELYEELLEFKEYVFVFCGDGPLRKDGIERFRTVENVLFPGWVKNVLVNIYISKAKFCLIPMSGYVLLEAASLGKCVVTSNLEWHSELVENEVNGLLVDPESISYWKEAIKKLMLNSIDIDRYGSNLFNKYLKLYSPEIAVRLEQEVYNDLLVQS